PGGPAVSRADARAPARPDQSAQPERLVGAQPGKLGKMRPQELALRFAFGASISVVAGLVSLAWGRRAGGMFLAFPAILPATLTLIEKKEGTDDARHDVAGAFLGAFGLVAFGAVTVWALHRMPVGLARSGARPYLEYDPEVSLEGAAAAANAKAPSCADLVAFGQARPGGVAVEVARGTTSANRSAAERACQLVADACGVAPLGVRNGDRPWLGQTTVPSWWVECACLDASDDQQALSRASFLVAAGEALAQARCG